MLMSRSRLNCERTNTARMQYHVVSQHSTRCAAGCLVVAVFSLCRQRPGLDAASMCTPLCKATWKACSPTSPSLGSQQPLMQLSCEKAWQASKLRPQFRTRTQSTQAKRAALAPAECGGSTGPRQRRVRSAIPCRGRHGALSLFAPCPWSLHLASCAAVQSWARCCAPGRTPPMLTAPPAADALLHLQQRPAPRQAPSRCGSWTSGRCTTRTGP